MELLLFKPTSRETFALNVHKVRGVFSTPDITKIPHAGDGIIGLISIRGSIMPVLDLAKCVGLVSDTTDMTTSFCIVVECLKKTVALLVEDVHKIISLESADLLDAFTCGIEHSHIEAIVKIDNDRLVSVLDLESLFIEIWGEPDVQKLGDDILPTDNRSLLCVDDSAVARKSLNNTLTKLGYKIETLSSAKEAISKATHTEDFLVNHYIAWLIDAEMPGMDGFELIQQLKTLASATKLPLYILTSMSGDAISEKSLKAGADGCLVKFDIDALTGKLRYLTKS